MAGFIRHGGAHLVLLAAMVMSVAVAQPDRSATADQIDPQVLLQELEQVQQQLLQIQDAAMTNHPELQQQAEDLQRALLEAMRENGFEPDASLARVDQLERQLQAGDGEREQRQVLADELRDEQQKLIAAEQEALENEKVKQVSDEFTQNLLQAMREEDPQTDTLVMELKQKHTQLQEIITARAGR